MMRSTGCGSFVTLAWIKGMNLCWLVDGKALWRIKYWRWGIFIALRDRRHATYSLSFITVSMNKMIITMRNRNMTANQFNVNVSVSWWRRGTWLTISSVSRWKQVGTSCPTIQASRWKQQPMVKCIENWAPLKSVNKIIKTFLHYLVLEFQFHIQEGKHYRLIILWARTLVSEFAVQIFPTLTI